MAFPATLKVPVPSGYNKTYIEDKNTLPLKCHYWNTKTGKWSDPLTDTHCKNKGKDFYTYNSKNDLTSITCECTHLSEFGVSFFKAPETGDSGKEKTETWV